MSRFGLLVLTLLGCLSPPQADELIFSTHYIKPFAWQENNQLRGMAVDMAREMIKDMGGEQAIQVLPFARGLRNVKTGAKQVMFVVAKTPDRESCMQWVGPIISNDVYFYKLKSSAFKLEQLADLADLTISVGRGNSDHSYLLKLGLGRLIPAGNQKASLQMLRMGRVDVSPMGEMVIQGMAEDANINPDDFERTNLKLYESELYFAFSSDVPAATVLRWQQAFARLKDSGKYQKITRAYLVEQ